MKNFTDHALVWNLRYHQILLRNFYDNKTFESILPIFFYFYQILFAILRYLISTLQIITKYQFLYQNLDSHLFWGSLSS